MRLVSEYRIADVIVVGYLNVVEKYHVLKLGGVPHNTIISDKCRTSYKCAGTHFCFMSDYARTSDVIVRIPLCIFCNPHILFGMIILICRKRRTDLEYQFLDTFKRFPRIRKSFKIISCQRM